MRYCGAFMLYEGCLEIFWPMTKHSVVLHKYVIFTAYLSVCLREGLFFDWQNLLRHHMNTVCHIR